MRLVGDTPLRLLPLSVIPKGLTTPDVAVSSDSHPFQTVRAIGVGAMGADAYFGIRDGGRRLSTLREHPKQRLQTGSQVTWIGESERRVRVTGAANDSSFPC